MQKITIMVALAMTPLGMPAVAFAQQPLAQSVDIGDEPTFERIKMEVEKRTADLLIDPESARFKYPYMTIAERGPKRISGWTTCAMVNSKNSMGGYGGYQIAFIRFAQGNVTYFNIVDDEGGQREFLCGQMPTRAE